MDSLDYKAYEKSLELVYESALKDYYSMFNAVSQQQALVARTYLWVSAALIGAYTAALDRFSGYIFGSEVALTLSAFALMLGGMGFGVCLYAFPARKGHLKITGEGWGEFSGLAYEKLESAEPQAYITFLSKVIGQVDEAYVHCAEVNGTRGAWLRATSWILIFSFALAVCAGLTTLAKVHFCSI